MAASTTHAYEKGVALGIELCRRYDGNARRALARAEKDGPEQSWIAASPTYRDTWLDGVWAGALQFARETGAWVRNPGEWPMAADGKLQGYARDLDAVCDDLMGWIELYGARAEDFQDAQLARATLRYVALAKGIAEGLAGSVGHDEKTQIRLSQIYAAEHVMRRIAGVE
jgi:hypothetical protein